MPSARGSELQGQHIEKALKRLKLFEELNGQMIPTTGTDTSAHRAVSDSSKLALRYEIADFTRTPLGLVRILPSSSDKMCEQVAGEISKVRGHALLTYCH